MNIVLLGPPGAGEGTQGERLALRCGVPRYSTGDVLREAVRDGAPLGREARRHMDAGELVPDRVVLALVREVLSGQRSPGFILDGFPRTVAQAEGLAALLSELGQKLDAVVYFDVPEDELVSRLSGRRVCAGCGAVYNVHSDPSVGAVCRRCRGRLETRDDDRVETVQNRLRVYRTNTEPLLEWYGASTTPLYRLAAAGTVDEVYERLLGALGCS
jgi:adenylate kinase